MSKRARNVGKEIASQPMPFDYSTWVENTPSNHEIHALLAPVVVCTDGKAAVGLMLSCKAWRDAIRPEVPKFMKKVNEAFGRAQKASYAQARAPAPTVANAIFELTRVDAQTVSEEELSSGNHPLVNAKLVEMQEKTRQNRKDIADFCGMGSLFGWVDVQGFHTAIKQVTLLHAEDPRQGEMVAAAASPKSYILGDENCITYACMSMQKCEVCAPLGIQCSAGSEGLWAPAPYAHGTTTDCFRLLCCDYKCVGKQCFAYNVIGHNPLELKVRDDRSVSTAWSSWNEPNNKLLEHTLRHMGFSVPITSSAFEERLRPGDVKLVEKHASSFWSVNAAYGVPPAARVRIDGDDRTARAFWLRHHPTLPSDYSFEAKLRIPGQAIRLAESDTKRIEDMNAAVKKATLLATRDKLFGDFTALLAETSGLASQGLTSIDALDAHFPGVCAVVECLVDKSASENVSHILDMQLTRILVRALDAMAVDMRRWDQSYSVNNRLASGYAYSWITGVSTGLVPGATLLDIGGRLNDDPVLFVYGPGEWRHHITTMHVFDALVWNKLNVFKPPKPSTAGSSSDPLPSVVKNITNNIISKTLNALLPNDVDVQCIYRITFDDQTASQLAIEHVVVYSSSRNEWLETHRRAAAMLDKCELEAELPPVPAQRHLDEMDDIAMNWIEVMAQTLGYYPKTRALALDILTNNSTRGLIEAVGLSCVDIEMLDMICAIKEADDMPMD